MATKGLAGVLGPGHTKMNTSIMSTLRKLTSGSRWEHIIKKHINQILMSAKENKSD